MMEFLNLLREHSLAANLCRICDSFSLIPCCFRDKFAFLYFSESAVVHENSRSVCLWLEERFVLVFPSAFEGVPF